MNIDSKEISRSSWKLKISIVALRFLSTNPIYKLLLVQCATFCFLFCSFLYDEYKILSKKKERITRRETHDRVIWTSSHIKQGKSFKKRVCSHIHSQSATKPSMPWKLNIGPHFKAVSASLHIVCSYLVIICIVGCDTNCCSIHLTS